MYYESTPLKLQKTQVVRFKLYFNLKELDLKIIHTLLIFTFIDFDQYYHKPHCMSLFMKIFKCIFYKNLQVKSRSKNNAKFEPSFIYICQNIETKKGVERNNENILRVV